MSKILLESELEIIRRFFDYDLSQEELTVFNNRLNSDADFAREVENYRLAYDTIDQFVHKNKSMGLPEKPVRESSDSSPKKRNLLLWFLPIILIGLLLAGYFILQQNAENNQEQIFAQANEYTQLMSDDILRGDNAMVDVTAEEIRLKNIIQSYPSTDATTTIAALNDFIAQSDNMIHEELAEWWIANIYLQQKDVVNAKEILNRIKDNPDYNSSRKAASFLEQL